jgi:hypothetical protein
MSPVVKVFGCRPTADGAANAEAGPAFENLQRRKSRDG